MAPATPYKGPVALGYSKYASPHMRQALPANVAVPMSSIASTVADNIIATKEQIDATKEQSITEIKPKATAATLAISQGQALKEEIAEHTAKLSQTVSSTCSNTRKLLELIRTALQKVDPDALKTTEHLWAELEELFKVASNAKHALPDFLEKQRNSMALYHASQINDVYRDTQMELDIQHNKVNLQHGLILEQQQAYKDHKARTEGQLQERDELKDRLSRLTLEKGHLRTELDEQSHIILEGVTTRAENSEKMTTLQQDNDKHEAEITELSNTITSMREKQDAIKKDFTERFTAEIHRKDEQLAKKSAECVTLKEENSRLTMEAEKGKEEKSRMEKKLAYMSHEHATLFSKDNENNSTLKHVREENSNLSQRIRQLVDVEKQNDVHQQEIAKQKENIAALNKVEHENRELQAMVEKLKTVSPGTQDITLVEKVETLEQEKDSMQHAISDWKSLAEKSFMEYKKMLPKYEKADEYRLDAMSKAQEIVNLKHELATAKTSQSKGSGSGADAAYWRSKYDNLLANYGN